MFLVHLREINEDIIDLRSASCCWILSVKGLTNRSGVYIQQGHEETWCESCGNLLLLNETMAYYVTYETIW